MDILYEDTHTQQAEVEKDSNNIEYMLNVYVHMYDVIYDITIDKNMNEKNYA